MTARTTNGFDAQKTQSFVDRIEALDRQKESERGAFMATCREIEDDKNEILEEAKGAGIPTKALKRVLKTRALERKVEAIRDALEDDEQDTFDLIRQALGDLQDTPLGQAALEKKTAKAKQASADVDALTD